MPPYQYGNPPNDFYIRQAQALSQQNPQYQQFQPQQFQQTHYQPVNFPVQQQPQKPSIIASAVTNIEEAKATRIEPMSVYVFLDTSCGKIYLKQFQNDGTSSFTTFEQLQTAAEQKPDPLGQSMDMLDKRLSNIELMIGEIKNAKSVPDACPVPEKPDGGYPAANVAENGGSEPAAVPKGDGHGWRKK